MAWVILRALFFGYVVRVLWKELEGARGRWEGGIVVQEGGGDIALG